MMATSQGNTKQQYTQLVLPGPVPLLVLADVCGETVLLTINRCCVRTFVLLSTDIYQSIAIQLMIAITCCHVAVCQGEITVLPWAELEGLHQETSLIKDQLLALNAAGGQYMWLQRLLQLLQQHGQLKLLHACAPH